MSCSYNAGRTRVAALKCGISTTAAKAANAAGQAATQIGLLGAEAASRVIPLAVMSTVAGVIAGQKPAEAAVEAIVPAVTAAAGGVAGREIGGTVAGLPGAVAGDLAGSTAGLRYGLKNRARIHAAVRRAGQRAARAMGYVAPESKGYGENEKATETTIPVSNAVTGDTPDQPAQNG